VTEKSPYLPEEDSPPPPPSPWGFRILVAVAAVYLALRLWQGVEWLWERITG
jgi:hypothetical protein